jgi:hypothetical protein
MENKNKIGALVMLGGIALLGYYYFKKNKPTTASTQLGGLENLSNYYKSGGTQVDTALKSNVQYVPTTEKDVIDKGVGGVLSSFNNLSQSESQKLKESIDKVCPSCSALGNIGMPTLSQQTVSELQNMQTGLGGINFSNIKI